MKPDRGFTLIELLLAMAVTALLAVLAYSGLSTALNSAERHRQVMQQLASLQTVLLWLERDLIQARWRPVDNAWGEEQPALAGGELQDFVLRLTRDGWDNPRQQQRGELQRVRYRIDAEGRLWRQYWPVLDRADEDRQLNELQLAEGVQRLALEFLDREHPAAANSELGGQWLEDWPPAGSTRQTLPRAVRLTVELENMGRVTRVVELPNGSDE